MKDITTPKIFFPNLDGLRFFSFLLVFFSHSFNVDNIAIKKTIWYNFIKVKLFSDGDIGVSFFFVLSGFLITYLLLVENELSQNINVIKFYIRRVLRIWPLYYAVLFFGFIIFPILKQQLGQVPNETANSLLCLTFLNNFDRMIHIPDASVISVLWSVAIEEQFYLIWPILFYFTPKKYFLHLIITIIILSTLFRFLYIHQTSIDIHTFGVISDMALGGLFAYFSIYNNAFLNWVKNLPKWFIAVVYIFVICFIVFKQELFFNDFMQIIKRLIMGVVFSMVIIEQNFAKKSLFKVGNWKVISKLGKYTYGLYCLHPIAILISLTMIRQFGLNQYSWQIWLLELPISLLLSILISWLSFNYFERVFLSFKSKFDVVYIKKNT